MEHNITIRRLTRSQIVTRMKDAGVTQKTIAKRVGVTQAFVSRIIARRGVVRPSIKSERVWGEIEKAVNG